MLTHPDIFPTHRAALEAPGRIGVPGCHPDPNPTYNFCINYPSQQQKNSFAHHCTYPYPIWQCSMQRKHFKSPNRIFRVNCKRSLLAKMDISYLCTLLTVPFRKNTFSPRTAGTGQSCRFAARHCEVHPNIRKFRQQTKTVPFLTSLMTVEDELLNLRLSQLCCLKHQSRQWTAQRETKQIRRIGSSKFQKLCANAATCI